MSRSARIAVIGAGLIGKRHIAEAVRQAALCAIVDPSDAAQAEAEAQGVPWCASLEEALALRPDGVVLATPNHLHAPQALQVIAAGIPLLIEKPIADTADAARAIEEAAEGAGVPVLIGHHRRHNPIVQRAKAEIEAGTLGEIVAVTGQFWLYKPDDYFDAAWRKGAGGGPALINFIHDIDLLRHFCGDLAEVQAMRSNVQRGGAVEDTAAVMMRFTSGALGTFTLSDTVVAPDSWEMRSGENPIYPHRPGACYRLGGTHASLSVPDLTLWQHEGARSWWNPIAARKLEAPEGDAFARQFTHFLDVLSGADPLVSAAEGRRALEAVLEVLDAALPEDPR